MNLLKDLKDIERLLERTVQATENTGAGLERMGAALERIAVAAEALLTIEQGRAKPAARSSGRVVN